MLVGDAEIGQLLDALNKHERSGDRGKRHLFNDVIGSACSDNDHCSGAIDQSRSGSLSLGKKESFSLTLKDGTILGRGLLGDTPLKDPPGAVNGRTWRVWEVRWVGDRLICLRCHHEWTPSQSCPQQCPECVGLLAVPDGNEAHSASRRERHGEPPR